MASDPYENLRLSQIGSQRVNSPDYRWSNTGRKAHAIVQLTRRGRCYFEAPEGGGRVFVPVGSVFITEVPSDSAYGYSPDEEAPYELVYFCLHGSLALALAADFRQRHGAIVPLTSMPESFSIFRRIQHLYGRHAFRDRFDMSDRLFRFFASLNREAGAEVARTDPVAACYQRIQNHFREPFSIKELAAETDVSREHLTRAFSRRHGKSPGRMLRDLRLREARLLLESGTASLDSIARATGFREGRTLKRALAEGTVGSWATSLSHTPGRPPRAGRVPEGTPGCRACDE